MLALAGLAERLAAAPETADGLSRAEFLDAAAALVSPTGQVALTGTTRADGLPTLHPADGDGLDSSWLTIVAAVRPALTRLEAHQLTEAAPLRPWTNRPGDPWQTNPSDDRRLIAMYAVPELNLASMTGQTPIAVAAIDRFSEVIPAAEQYTGAAFGFDAPAARAQQAILLAVPPSAHQPLDQRMLVQILTETRKLTRVRMARPVDLDEQFRALTPSALLPASGAVAIPLEARE